MIEKQTVKAEIRETGRKGILQDLRRKGRVPAILYGHGFDAVTFSVDGKELTRAIKGGGMNALIELKFETGEASDLAPPVASAGVRGPSETPLKSKDASSLSGRRTGPLIVMIKDFQTDVVTHRMIHVDFLKLDMKEKVTVKVPIRLTGKAAGVEQGGLIEQTTRELEVKCLPGNIPEFLEVDISALNLGDSLHLTALKLPEGVEAPKDVTLTIVSIVAPKEEKVAEAAPVVAEGAAEAGGVPAEGAAAAPAAGAEGKEEKKESKK